MVVHPEILDLSPISDVLIPPSSGVKYISTPIYMLAGVGEGIRWGPEQEKRYTHRLVADHQFGIFALAEDTVCMCSAYFWWCIDELSMVVLSKWQFGTSFGAPTRSRGSVCTLLYLHWLCDPRRCEINRKVRAPKRVSASGAPHIVTWIKQTWIKHQMHHHGLFQPLKRNCVWMSMFVILVRRYFNGIRQDMFRPLPMSPIYRVPTPLLTHVPCSLALSCLPKGR